MADTTIRDEILNEVDKMTSERQQRVLEYARRITRPTPPGTQARNFSSSRVS